MIARVEPGSHFLLLKILYAISNAPKPTVASNVSKAKVSKSVIEHPKVYSCKQYYSPAVAISAGLWYIIDKESAVRQTVSTFLANQLKNDRRVGSSWGGHFLCVKIFHAISNTPKPTVASNVSRAKVSNSVIEHHPFRSRASGARQKIFASPTLGPERLDRLPYVDSTPKVSIADVSPFFNAGSVCFLLSDGQN